MKPTPKVLIISGILVIFIANLIASRLSTTIYTAETPVAHAAIALTHEQQVWLDALEWQESQGKAGAINPKDSDGTPSYGCFQFKPGTFNYYSQKYGIATTSIMSCAEQTAIVTAMIQHRNEIDWHSQFPASVAHLGLPPVALSTTSVDKQ
jgi:hypothetical protein